MKLQQKSFHHKTPLVRSLEEIEINREQGARGAVAARALCKALLFFWKRKDLH